MHRSLGPVDYYILKNMIRNYVNQSRPTPKPVMHIAYSPYIRNIYKFPSQCSFNLGFFA